MNRLKSAHKWWSTLKFAVISLSSSLPLLVSEGGRLVCELDGKADQLSDHFDNKQSTEAVDLQLAIYQIGSSEGRHLLLDLDPYGGTDPLGMFPLLLKRTDVMAPSHSVEFRQLVRLGSFPACWRQPMSPKFCKVRCPPLLPITDRFS